MARNFLWMISLPLLSVAILTGCESGFSVPPSNPSSPCTPTSTPSAAVTYYICPTPAPAESNCQDASSFTALTGTITYITYTGNPSLNSQSVSGPLPYGGSTSTPVPYGGENVVQTAADWSALVSSSASPSTSYPIPFNPSTQTLLVISSASFDCCNELIVQSVCNTGSQLIINVGWTFGGGTCVDNAGAGNINSRQSTGLAIPKCTLPVVWVNPCLPLPYSCMIPN